MSDSLFERFVKDSPISVTVRAAAERALNLTVIDKQFEMNAEKQYTKDLLFSTVFDLMTGVVICGYPSVHAVCQYSQNEISVSVKSVYN
ncbi:hypothetical protein QUF90_04665 [Desulfococcaceae bacterium HSG9]|nr:hypothetical protein [Desulfococcaceae bacterium HSG9]